MNEMQELIAAKHEALKTKTERTKQTKLEALQSQITSLQEELTEKSCENNNLHAQLQYECRNAKLLLEYYFKTLIAEDSEILQLNQGNPAEYLAEGSNDDMTTRYLSNDEYVNLSVTERNQLVLDRFWKSNKSKQTIGRLCEQYAGWLYENFALKRFPVAYRWHGRR